MPRYYTDIPGLPGGALETDYPIRFNMTAIDGYQRSGQKARTPRRSIQHGTDNPNNPSAWQEAQYFVNGAEGRQASVHSFTDDTEVVIGVPLDEVAWQAADGSGPGNMNGFANEMMEATVIWNSSTRRNRMIAIAADFMGRVAARLGATKPERHWDFNAGSPDRHHCPNLLMNTGLWDSMYVPMWQAARTDELQRMKGDTPTTTTTPAPTPPPTKPIYAPRITTGFTGKDTAVTRKVTIKTGEKDAKGKAITEDVDVVYDIFEMVRPFEVTHKTRRRQGPGSRDPQVGEMLEVRETLTSRYVAVPRKQPGKIIPKSNFVISDAITWILAEHLSPRFTMRKA